MGRSRQSPGGFHKRKSVVAAERVDDKGRERPLYDNARITARSRLITLAIDARARRFPTELRYHYAPLADEVDDLRWNDKARLEILHDYNLNDLFL
jgi:hypothetical protein